METALFSPSSLFAGSDDSDNSGGEEAGDETLRRHAFPGPTVPSINLDSVPDSSVEDLVYVFDGVQELVIREFSFHQLNANLLWPGTFSFADWLFQNHELLHGRRILELGSGTGALAIFLQKTFGVDITTSDFDDKDVEENIAYNCKANDLSVLPHLRHTWGDNFPIRQPDWDLIIASDILLYVKQYPNLIKTLCFLLNCYKPKNPTSCKSSVIISGKQVRMQWPVFLMSWRRRIGKEDEAVFFTGCEDAGLVVEHVGSRVYCISRRG